MSCRLPILLLLLSFITTARGQDTLYNAVHLHYGMGHLHRQDLILSPAIHSVWSPVNTTVQIIRSKKFEQQAHLRFSSFKAITREPFTFISPFSGNEITSYPHSFLLADLNYSLGRTYRTGNNWKVFLGGSSNNRLNLSSYNFGLYGSTIYYIAFGLDIWAKAEYLLSEKHSLNASIWIPAISWVSRSPFLSVDDQYLADNFSHSGLGAFFKYIKRGEIQSWLTTQRMDMALTYSYVITEKWGLGVSYWFSINKNKQSGNFSSIENLLYLTGCYKF